MQGLGRANSKVASRENLDSQGMPQMSSANKGVLAQKHQELIDRSLQYQAQGYLEYNNNNVQSATSSITQPRRKSPALRRLESGSRRNKG